MRYIPHNTVHRSGEVDFVLVIHGDADKQLSISHRTADILSQLVSFQSKVVRITGYSSVPHMSEFDLVSPGKKAVKYGRDFAFKDELSVDQPNFFLRHLCLSSAASSLLSPCRRRPVMVFIFLLGIQIFCEG